MPQSWLKNWPLPPSGSETERDTRIHRIGNLTLLTKKLNSTVSNGPWLGDGGKTTHLLENDVVLLNSRLLKDYASKQWDETGIDSRTQQAIETVIAIWTVPKGHTIHIDRERTDTSVAVEIADLLGAGYLTPGQTLYSRPGKYGGHSGKILSDGRIEVADHVFDSPSSAAIFIRNKSTNGWNFWRLEPSGHRPLNEVRAEYLRVVSPEEAEGEDTNSSEVD